METLNGTPQSGSPEMAYLLRQADCRASYLAKSAPFRLDEWEDLRQELFLDCLRRSASFDSARGAWRGFVHGLVRNQSHVLTRRQVTARRTLSADGGEVKRVVEKLQQASNLERLDLSVDVKRALCQLPTPLRSMATLLAEFSVSEISRSTGKSRSSINRMIRRIRTEFQNVGLTPDSLGIDRRRP